MGITKAFPLQNTHQCGVEVLKLVNKGIFTSTFRHKQGKMTNRWLQKLVPTNITKKNQSWQWTNFETEWCQAYICSMMHISKNEGRLDRSSIVLSRISVCIGVQYTETDAAVGPCTLLDLQSNLTQISLHLPNSTSVPEEALFWHSNMHKERTVLCSFAYCVEIFVRALICTYIVIYSYRNDYLCSTTVQAVNRKDHRFSAGVANYKFRDSPEVCINFFVFNNRTSLY